MILASQAHQVPHVGLPHIEPVTKATRLNINPDGAKLFATKKNTLFLKWNPDDPLGYKILSGICTDDQEQHKMRNSNFQSSFRNLEIIKISCYCASDTEHLFRTKDNRDCLHLTNSVHWIDGTLEKIFGQWLIERLFDDIWINRKSYFPQK